MSALISRRSTPRQVLSHNGPKSAEKNSIDDHATTEIPNLLRSWVRDSSQTKTLSNQASCSLKTPVLPAPTHHSMPITLKAIEFDTGQSFSAGPMHFLICSESREFKVLRGSSLVFENYDNSWCSRPTVTVHQFNSNTITSTLRYTNICNSEREKVDVSDIEGQCSSEECYRISGSLYTKARWCSWEYKRLVLCLHQQ